MSEKIRFSDRLNSALDEAGFPALGDGRQSSIAELLDETVANVGSWLEGLEYPKTSKLVKLAKLVHVRSNWLLSGAGDKFEDEVAEKNYRQLLMEQLATKKRKLSEKKSGIKALNNVLSEDAIALASDYMKLSNQQQQKIQTLIRKLQQE